jgi:hypothetical protein
MYTYFIAATESEVARMRFLSEVLDHIEKIEPKLGGNVDIGAISSIWDEESWRETGVNRMDLAGFLLDLAALCNAAQAKNADVYALLSKR